MSHLFKTEVTGDDQAFGGVAGEVYCIGLMVVLNISVSSSILTLTAVAVERFCSIMFPFKRIISLKIVKSMMIGIWITSCAITIPFFFHIKVEDYYGDGVFYCVESTPPTPASSAMNPIIYVAFHSEYRKQLKVILLRCTCFPLCIGLCKARTGNGLDIQGRRTVRGTPVRTRRTYHYAKVSHVCVSFAVFSLA